MTDINEAVTAAASGLRAQTTRLRIAAENIANADSTANGPNGEPFRRRIPLLESAALPSGAEGVIVKGATFDMSSFRREYNPSHPAAGRDGYVEMPNVDPLVEMMDIRDASRAYEANLNMIDAARNMTARALDLLRK
jgi:flagellar basal-body rod protein FlgC